MKNNFGKFKFILGSLAPEYMQKTEMENRLTSYLMFHFGPISKVVQYQGKWNAPVSYIQEIGHDLVPTIYIFQHPIYQEEIAIRKKTIMQIEEGFSFLGKRLFILNPGIVSQKGLFLASHKPAPIRSSIGSEVWLEKQLKYDINGLTPLSNTFSEYATEEIIYTFNKSIENLILKSDFIAPQNSRIYLFS